jgi:signal transduction histidine kinase
MTPAPCGRHFPPNPRRGRPPWWPEGEPWPPPGPPGARAWQRMRRRFLLRAVLFLSAVILFTTGVSALFRWGATTLLRLPGVPPGATGIGQTSLVAMLALVLVGAIAVGRAVRRMAAPVGDLMAALGRVADGDYSARVPERGPHEAWTLTRAFNTMAERLQRHEEQRRGLLVDISHELRTPLTVLQGNLEGMLDGVYSRDDAHLSLILDETRVLARVIEDLRTLSLAEDLGLKLVKTPADLEEIARDAVASFQAQAGAAGVTLRVQAGPGMPRAELDPERIRQVLNNLLSNALRYTPRGGEVVVRCYPEDSAHIAFSVEDTGSGIPPAELPHIFDRFYKSKDSRGTGLGLAIARSLVSAHGGEISASSAPGQGTTIRVILPIHPDP